MQHYTEGDRICILGISTGGYIGAVLWWKRPDVLLMITS